MTSLASCALPRHRHAQIKRFDGRDPSVSRPAIPAALIPRSERRAHRTTRFRTFARRLRAGCAGLRRSFAACPDSGHSSPRPCCPLCAKPGVEVGQARLDPTSRAIARNSRVLPCNGLLGPREAKRRVAFVKIGRIVPSASNRVGEGAAEQRRPPRPTGQDMIWTRIHRTR